MHLVIVLNLCLLPAGLLASPDKLSTDVGFKDDPNTLSRPDFWRITNINFDLSVDFNLKILQGFVDIDIVQKSSTVKDTLILDTRALSIDNVTLRNDTAEIPLHFTLDNNSDFRGSQLIISLQSSSPNQTIRIHFSTCPGCASGLVWMTPAQTSGKIHPFLFSSSVALHARSIFPCQDTPSVKFTYSARITVKNNTALTVLMSAIGQGDHGGGVFTFQQSIPVPSYLVAIAVGHLAKRKIGPRSDVWSEPELLDKAAFEFGDVEEMLVIAEDMVGEYVWGVYDLLVMPPSFPFGAMENPCLTFVTPTILAGDRSLVGAIAHEISHSWTGNLVTHKNWEHFWMKEGPTMFLERKILARMHGEAYRQMECIEGYKELKEEVERRGLNDSFTKLIPDLNGRNPDDAYGIIPYEKGHSLMYYLEEQVGAENFTEFLRAWIDKYKYTSTDSYAFRDFFMIFFQNRTQILDSIDWSAWFNGTGMPPVKLQFDDSLVRPATALKNKWISSTDLSNFTREDIANLTVQQKVNFLGQLLEQDHPLTIDKLNVMNATYKFSATSNTEIKFRWLRLCIRGQWEDVILEALDFAVHNQRMRYSRPIFRDLFAWDKSRKMTVETFLQWKSTMAFVTASQIATDLNIPNKS